MHFIYFKTQTMFRFNNLTAIYAANINNKLKHNSLANEYQTTIKYSRNYQK